MKHLNLTQNKKWPFSYTVKNNDESFRIDVILAVLSSKDTLNEANARPENRLIHEYLKLMVESVQSIEGKLTIKH